jgi:hypothetical protein
MWDSIFKKRYRGNDDDDGRRPNLYRDRSRRDAYDPHVFGHPSGFLASQVYRESLNIPYYGQRVGAGTINPVSLPASRAAAGVLTSTFDANGNRIYSVLYNAVPQDV